MPREEDPELQLRKRRFHSLSVTASLPYHFEPVMGDIGKPIRETERPAPVRAPEPEPEPIREPPPPEREPEPVEAQRA